MKALPKKLSDRILLALHDLELCEADPNYEIEMGNWHVPWKGICEVCLSGSVMAKTLRTPIIDTKYPKNFPDKLRDQLEDIELVRTGTGPVDDWYFTYETMMLDDLSDKNRDEWKLHMCDVIGRLQAEGK